MKQALHYTGSFLSVVGAICVYFAILYGIYETFVGSTTFGLALIAASVVTAYAINVLYNLVCPPEPGSTAVRPAWSPADRPRRTGR